MDSKSKTLPKKERLCGAAGSRTRVQTRKPAGFYMLISSWFSRLAWWREPEPILILLISLRGRGVFSAIPVVAVPHKLGVTGRNPLRDISFPATLSREWSLMALRVIKQRERNYFRRIKGCALIFTSKQRNARHASNPFLLAVKTKSTPSKKFTNIRNRP